MKLLSVSADAKTSKGEARGWLTGILYLAPARQAGGINLCPHASPGCLTACLYSAGRGAFSNVQRARIAKTRRFLTDREGFLRDLREDIASLVAKARREGKRPCVRLNGTSDIAWERTGIFEAFPDVRFYDYTKNGRRMLDFIDRKFPANYHLTFSRSETNQAEALEILGRGGNVSVVFREPPVAWRGFEVVSGDETDLRFLDTPGRVIALTAKGKAKQDSSGFVL